MGPRPKTYDLGPTTFSRDLPPTTSPVNLVTGGTGFVGTHVVRALLAEGRRALCLVRQDIQRDNLDGLSVETVTGDLNDPASLASALSGISTLYHVAADYRLWAK